MIRSIFFRFLLATSIVAFTFCNKDTGVLQPQYGSISGKIINPPEKGLLICLVTRKGIDTTTFNPATQTFVFDHVKYGSCIVQVSADSSPPFEQLLILDKPSYVCHDIVLGMFPSRINYVYPNNSQYVDSSYLSIASPQATDSGLWCFINFSIKMDTTTVNAALTILPDTVGVRKEWTLTTSLAFFFTYKRLSTIDTVKIKIGGQAIDEWGDPLGRDFMTFYPIDNSYIRRAILKDK
jgi:hypothetical protein